MMVVHRKKQQQRSFELVRHRSAPCEEVIHRVCADSNAADFICSYSVRATLLATLCLRLASKVGTRAAQAPNE